MVPDRGRLTSRQMAAARWLDELAARTSRLVDVARALSVLPLAAVVHLSDKRSLVDEDVAQWLEVLGVNDGRHGLHSLLYAFGEFRALYYHRLAHGNPLGALAGRLLRHLFPPTPGLELQTAEIGSGLFIAHGHGTCIAAARIGRNCYVHQNVTIGWDYRSARPPIVGDGVFVGVGAAVLGAVVLGDGARVGANAVVLCDVPPGATAVGAPARVSLPPEESLGYERGADAGVPQQTPSRRPADSRLSLVSSQPFSAIPESRRTP